MQASQRDHNEQGRSRDRGRYRWLAFTTVAVNRTYGQSNERASRFSAVRLQPNRLCVIAFSAKVHHLKILLLLMAFISTRNWATFDQYVFECFFSRPSPTFWCFAIRFIFSLWNNTPTVRLDSWNKTLLSASPEVSNVGCYEGWKFPIRTREPRIVADLTIPCELFGFTQSQLLESEILGLQVSSWPVWEVCFVAILLVGL
jgi:hypothetical protein